MNKVKINAINKLRIAVDLRQLGAHCVNTARGTPDS